MRELAERAARAGMAAVTERSRAMDEAADFAIRAVLEAGDPGTPIFGEESGGELNLERGWVIDGIDGTENLVRGSDFFACTCALLENGLPVAGATGCPSTGEVWSAERGVAAPFAVDERGPIAVDPAEDGGELWNSVLAAVPEVQPRASMALELAHCAAGRFSGVVFTGSGEIQDYAAGVLLIEAAGGCVSPWPADVFVAGAPRTFEQLKRFVPRRSASPRA